MYIDFHTHIVPEIDDGAKDISMSLAMLSLARQSGADTVILTPHYSTKTDIGEFCSLREKKVAELKSAMESNPDDYPKILLGAEVALDGPLDEFPDISPLLIEGSEMLLLELPYMSWSSWYNNEIYNIIATHNVTPIMAHIERYIDGPKDIEKLATLVSFGVKFQVNASSFLSFSSRRIIRALADVGLVHAIASDCHSLNHRTPDIKKAVALMEKKLGADYMDMIYESSKNLLNNSK